MLVAYMVTLLVTEFVHGMKKCIIFKTLHPFIFCKEYRPALWSLVGRLIFLLDMFTYRSRVQVPNQCLEDKKSL
jgi:hypothetical protein